MPYQGSLNFARKLAAQNGTQNVKHELLLKAGHGHKDPAFSAPENVNKVLDFLDRVLSTDPKGNLSDR